MAFSQANSSILTVWFAGTVCWIEVWQQWIELLIIISKIASSFFWSVDQILGMNLKNSTVQSEDFNGSISLLLFFNIKIKCFKYSHFILKVKVTSTAVNKYEVQTSRDLHRLCNLYAPDLMTNMNRCKFLEFLNEYCRLDCSNIVTNRQCCPANTTLPTFCPHSFRQC